MTRRTWIEHGPRTAAARVRRALAIGTLGGAALVGCDGSSHIEGVLAPITLTSTTSGIGAGVGVGVGAARGASELLGSWTRVTSASVGVLLEQTYTFLGDGSGVRTTVTRTALGVALAVEQAPFEWDGGGGVLLVRFRRPGTIETAVRVPYVVRADIGATVLQLDGLEYRRSGG